MSNGRQDGACANPTLEHPLNSMTAEDYSLTFHEPLSSYQLPPVSGFGLI